MEETIQTKEAAAAAPPTDDVGATPTGPAAPAEAERPAAAVPAPVAEPEPEEPEEAPMTPAQMRVVRQLSRADRFEELLTRNTMEV